MTKIKKSVAMLALLAVCLCSAAFGLLGTRHNAQAAEGDDSGGIITIELNRSSPFFTTGPRDISTINSNPLKLFLYLSDNSYLSITTAAYASYLSSSKDYEFKGNPYFKYTVEIPTIYSIILTTAQAATIDVKRTEEYPLGIKAVSFLCDDYTLLFSGYSGLSSGGYSIANDFFESFTYVSVMDNPELEIKRYYASVTLPANDRYFILATGHTYGEKTYTEMPFNIEYLNFFRGGLGMAYGTFSVNGVKLGYHSDPKRLTDTYEFSFETPLQFEITEAEYNSFYSTSSLGFWLKFGDTGVFKASELANNGWITDAMLQKGPIYGDSSYIEAPVTFSTSGVDENVLPDKNDIVGFDEGDLKKPEKDFWQNAFDDIKEGLERDFGVKEGQTVAGAITEVVVKGFESLGAALANLVFPNGGCASGCDGVLTTAAIVAGVVIVLLIVLALARRK
jgi:hypothetical protein